MTDFSADPSNADMLSDAQYADHFSAVPMRNVTLPCGKIVAEPAWDKPCCVTSVTVKCGHGKRGFILIPPTTRTDKTYDQVIQVLGDKHDKDTVTIDFVAGECNRGNAPLLPALTFSDHRYGPSVKTVEVEAPKPPLGPLYLDDFMTLVLGNNPLKTANLYHGAVNCCQGAKQFDFRVEAYPYRKWTGKIGLGWEFENATHVVNYNDYSNPDHPVAKQARMYSIEDKGSLKFEGGIDVTFGDRKTSVKLPTVEVKTGKAPEGAAHKAFEGTKNFFEKTLPRMRVLFSNPLLTIKPIWPSLELSGEVETVEVKGRYNVERKGKVEFAASPLFGLSGTMDLLMWLLEGGCTALGHPELGIQLAKLKHRAEQGVGTGRFGVKGVCKIDFTATGKIGGAIEWEFGADGKNSGSGAIKADLDLELKGEISGELRFMRVSYTAGVSISGTSGAGGEIRYGFYGEEPGFSGVLKFKGLTLEAVVIHSVGGSSIGTHPAPPAAKEERKAEVDPKALRDSESDSLWKLEVIPPAQWPKAKEATLTEGGV